MATVTHFLVNILEPPAAGAKNMMVRVKEHDLKDIKKAAKLVNMTQSEFLRTTTIQAARQINKELTPERVLPKRHMEFVEAVPFEED